MTTWQREAVAWLRGKAAEQAQTAMIRERVTPAQREEYEARGGAPDFASWSPALLAQLAADQQAEIVRLNNELARTLAVLKDLSEAFEYECDQFCKRAVRNAAYRAAMEALK